MTLLPLWADYHGILVERLALIGVSHRRGGAAALESWQQAFDENALAALPRQGFAEFVPIVTCNRWDLVLRLPAGMSTEQARQQLTPRGQEVRPYAFVADGALEQLTRIAASLDSLNPGEDQIMAQVREAYAQARAQDTTGPITNFTFETALRIAKRVRREVPLAPLKTSLFSLARPALERLLGAGSLAVVLGTGHMGTLAAKSLASLPGVGLLLVNRSVERARQLARRLSLDHQKHVHSLALTDFLRTPPAATTALVCATPAGELVGETLLRKLPNLRLVVDLGVPRNVTAAAAAMGLEVLDVDTLQTAGQSRRRELADRLAAAEVLIQRELESARSEWAERQLGPSIRRLREWYLATIGEALPPAEARLLAHKFAHVPIKGLRALAREHGLAAAKTFLAETGLIDTGGSSE